MWCFQILHFLPISVQFLGENHGFSLVSVSIVRTVQLAAVMRLFLMLPPANMKDRHAWLLMCRSSLTCKIQQLLFSGMILHTLQPLYNAVELSCKRFICKTFFWEFYGLTDNLWPNFSGSSMTPVILLALAIYYKIAFCLSLQNTCPNLYLLLVVKHVLAALRTSLFSVCFHCWQRTDKHLLVE